LRVPSRVLLALLLSFFLGNSFAQDRPSWEIEEYLESYVDAYFNARYQKAADICEGAIAAVEERFGAEDTWR